MTQISRWGDILYWLMILAGAAILIPSLILPPWLEYRASLDLRALRQHQVDERQAELTKLRKQREHLETDDAYVLRVAREDLNIETPDVPRVRVEPGPDGESDADAPPTTAPADADTLAPEISSLADELAVKYPLLLQLFVRPDTRPPLMFIGVGMMLTAIVLLGAPVRKRVRRAAE